MRAPHAAAAGLLLAVVAADAGLQSAPVVQPATPNAVVTVDRNASGATRAFKFARVPSPVADDAAAKAKVTLIDGELDGQAGAVGSVNDGLLPRDEDEPGANFFFNAATTGGRLVVDLTSRVNITRINSYSWHPNTRGPQVYVLFASDGTDPKFNAAPKADVDPATVGWVRVAAIDTRPSGEDQGGQYGVSIVGRSGNLGQFRYLLFECSATELQDDYGNTFYSEIDVIAAPASAPSPLVSGSAAPTSGRLARR